jgi:DNA-binding NarL/FixJ family response regulator
MQGHLSLAETLGKEAARELYEMGDARSGMLARIMAAYAELLAAKHSEANDLLFASLSTARELEEPRLIAALLEVVARSLLEKGDADDAATLLGVCQAVRANGSRSLWGYSTIYDDALLETRSALPETESRERFSYGETIGLSDALDLAERALLAESAPPAKPPAKPASARGFLSPREQEVLQLVSLGRSNREIARNIYVSESTVKFHVTSILNKLGANTRTEAVSSAMRRGILSIKETDEAAI